MTYFNFFSYAYGQFFHMKYVVFYGVARVFLLADGVDAPQASLF